MLLTDVLEAYGVTRSTIDSIDNQSESGFNVRKMQAGKPFTILQNSESKGVDFFIYEETDESYVVIDLRKGIEISRGTKPVETELRSLHLPISTSLYEAVKIHGADVALVKSLEKIFAWQVDFFELDPGDYCKVLFEERYVDGSFVGIGRVLAAQFRQDGNDYYAFLHESDGVEHYYDQQSRHVRRAFLRSPVAMDTNAISSVLVDRNAKEYMYPTDPGVSVVAVASGKVVAVKQRRDGLSILIKHSSVFSSQYLHLSELAPGLGNEVEVAQGDTLGMVGQLPKTVGSGVGIRYWKQGKVSAPPRLEEVESSASPDLSDDPDFKRQIKAWKKQLAAIPESLS